jgi:hypothetical protein
MVWIASTIAGITIIAVLSLCRISKREAPGVGQ